jgi:hypothetical protein
VEKWSQRAKALSLRGLALSGRRWVDTGARPVHLAGMLMCCARARKRQNDHRPANRGRCRRPFRRREIRHERRRTSSRASSRNRTGAAAAFTTLIDFMEAPGGEAGGNAGPMLQA